jgi:hypothetical protein
VTLYTKIRYHSRLEALKTLQVDGHEHQSANHNTIPLLFLKSTCIIINVSWLVHRSKHFSTLSHYSAIHDTIPNETKCLWDQTSQGLSTNQVKPDYVYSYTALSQIKNLRERERSECIYKLQNAPSCIRMLWLVFLPLTKLQL